MDYENELRAEGFSDIYVWEDSPRAYYPDHTHPARTAHVVIDGEMALILGGETHLLRAGDRFDVPANALHSAKMGPAGCRYVVGRKI